MLKLVKKFIILLIVLIVCQSCFAEPSVIQRIQIEPLSSGISFNTVNLTASTGWVTAPTVEMRGRKQILITNISSTNNLYITGISGSTTTGIIRPEQTASFKASSDLHLYISANTTVSAEVWEIR